MRRRKPWLIEINKRGEYPSVRNHSLVPRAWEISSRFDGRSGGSCCHQSSRVWTLISTLEYGESSSPGPSDPRFRLGRTLARTSLDRAPGGDKPTASTLLYPQICPCKMKEAKGKRKYKALGRGHKQLRETRKRRTG